MAFDFTLIEEEANAHIRAVNSLAELEPLRLKYLGRSGLLTEITGSIPGMEQALRPEFGRKANILKNKLMELFDSRVKELKNTETANAGGYFDSTLPGILPKTGTIHPLSSTMNAICLEFQKMGFVVVEGPEIETEYNNFTGLNIPLDHPSRDGFDTFYIEKPENREQKTEDRKQRIENKKKSETGRLLLRSHTSPVQIRVMKQYKPPLAVVVPGKVYRPDATDASHSFMFHQIEGFLVDEGIKFSDLKGALGVFIKNFFGEDTAMRFRPHFFPFTEPSAEVDISCILCSEKTENRKQRTEDRKQKTEIRGRQPQGKPEPEGQKRCPVCFGKGWLEVLGCGMIHPNVLSNVGYPKGKYSGFAFGMGVDRLAMLKYAVEDIRLFYENDLRFLKQF